MYRELVQAIIGKIYANIMCRTCKADKYIFFPESKGAYLKWGIKLLPQYIDQNKHDKIIVIATDYSVKKNISKQGITSVRFKKVSKYSMDCLLDYYALKDMSAQWVVVSTKKPYDTGAEHLLGIRGVTYRDIVYYDIYKLDGEVT